MDYELRTPAGQGRKKRKDNVVRVEQETGRGDGEEAAGRGVTYSW